MKHLKRFNESKSKSHQWFDVLLKVQDEVEGRFVITINEEPINDIDTNKDLDEYEFNSDDTYIEFNDMDGACFTDWTLGGFSVERLRFWANKTLDEDKSDYDCSEEVCDDYDELATSVLVALDKGGFRDEDDTVKPASDEYQEQLQMWSSIAFSLQGEREEHIFGRVKELMKRYKITKR